MTQCLIAFKIVSAFPIPSTWTKPSESSKSLQRKPTLAPSFGFVVFRRVIGTLSYHSPMNPLSRTLRSLNIMGGHVFTDGSGGAETKDPRLRRCGYGVTWIFPTVVCLTHWEEELAFCMAETNQWQGPNFLQQLKLSDWPGKLRGKSSSGPIA